MHTWSLGVEEQYYIIYPLILILIGRRYASFLLPLLIVLTALSLTVCLLPFPNHFKFYYLPFRFFELATGGIAAILLKNRTIITNYGILFLLLLFFILFFSSKFLSTNLSIFVTVLITALILSVNNLKNNFVKFILANKVSTGLGLISFSLYMWHQVILSFSKYFILDDINYFQKVFIILVILSLSICSYFLIERPFRNKQIISLRSLVVFLGFLFFSTTASAYYIYIKSGVIRDVPELDIYTNTASRGMHSKYNSRIYSYDKPFALLPDKIKVLIIGNSFARDWANVLLESKYKDIIDISYIYDHNNHLDFQDRSEVADVIFISTASRASLEKLKLDYSKIYIVGTKNFGKNNGFFYNYSGADYFSQRTLMEDGYIALNESLKNEWQEKYINLIDKIMNPDKTVPVFTDANKFISQDCRHFTKSGAVFFSKLFQNELFQIFEKTKKSKLLTISTNIEY